jgi:hypothetical protein
MARIEYQVDYPAAATTVLAVLTAEGFLDDYAREIGALRWAAGITQIGGAPATELDFVVATEGIPPVFRRFVGSSIEVNDRRTWAPPVAGVHRAALAVDAALATRHARVRGTITLASDGAGSRFTATGDVDVHMPPVSRVAAGQVVQLIRSVLERESAVVRRRLNSSPGADPAR